MASDDRQIARLAEQNLTDLFGEEEATENWQEWLSWFERRIAWMIEHRFERLMSILYRIDVDEKSVKDALTDTSISESAKRIASLLIERECEKVASRLRYRSTE